MKPSMLFLAHRIPYPPNKGDKLRAWHLLKGLSENWDIRLGTLIDDLEDNRWKSAFDDVTSAQHFGDITARSQKTAGLQALMRGEPTTYSVFREASLMRWVTEEDRKRPFDMVFVYSSGAAPYLAALKRPVPTVIDFVDVDSAKWEALGESTSGPMGWVYAREGRLLALEEKRLAQDADLSLFVTRAEAGLFRARSGLSDRIHVVENGVDLDYWAESKMLPSPYDADGKHRIILTGAMDYAPNVEGAEWIAREVLPRLRSAGVRVEFVIAGARPAPAVKALAADSDIRVTGRVEDMRPWLGKADLALAPLQIARGVQNKVLEAMASSTPVIASPAAMEGIDASAEAAATLPRDGAKWAETITALLMDPAARVGMAAAAARHVRMNYGWGAKVAALEEMLSGIRPASGNEESAA